MHHLVRLIGASLVLGLATVAFAAEKPVQIPAPTVEIEESGTATAIFAGGCFWGVQGVFQHVEGVKSAISGYAGGSAKHAKYGLVSDGRTKHAEAVKIEYDPAKISYGELMQIFFSVAHNPTQLNRQGPDIGTQYRSAIFPTSESQAKSATAYIGELDQAKAYDAKIVTRIESGTFYPAEAHNQDFMVKNPTNGYIAYNDLPKIGALKSFFPKFYRDKPVLVGPQS